MGVLSLGDLGFILPAYAAYEAYGAYVRAEETKERKKAEAVQAQELEKLECDASVARRRRAETEERLAELRDLVATVMARASAVRALYDQEPGLDAGYVTRADQLRQVAVEILTALDESDREAVLGAIDALSRTAAQAEKGHRDAAAEVQAVRRRAAEEHARRAREEESARVAAEKAMREAERRARLARLLR